MRLCACSARGPAEPSTVDLCRLFPIRLIDCETGSNFGRREAKNSLPPSLWKSFFCPSIACNLQEINSLHFQPVDESVTVDPRFCPYLTLKRADLTPKWPEIGCFLMDSCWQNCSWPDWPHNLHQRRYNFRQLALKRKNPANGLPASLASRINGGTQCAGLFQLLRRLCCRCCLSCRLPRNRPTAQAGKIRKQ